MKDKIKDLMGDFKEEAEENGSVKAQILKGDKVMDEVSGKGFLGIVIVEEDDGEEFHFVVGGRLSEKSAIIAKYNFNRGVERFLNEERRKDMNPFEYLAQGLEDMVAGTD